MEPRSSSVTMSCTPAAGYSSGGSNSIKKSPGVIAREEARRKFVKPEAGFREQYMRESLIADLPIVPDDNDLI